MTNAELIAKIKAEIERLHAEHSSRYGTDEAGLVLENLEDFLSILESEKPVPNDLEEAAKKFVGYDMDCDELRDYEMGIAAFIAGYNLHKEQMLKGAVPFYEILKAVPPGPERDNTRIIIVKE